MVGLRKSPFNPPFTALPIYGRFAPRVTAAGLLALLFFLFPPHGLGPVIPSHLICRRPVPLPYHEAPPSLLIFLLGRLSFCWLTSFNPFPPALRPGGGVTLDFFFESPPLLRGFLGGWLGCPPPFFSPRFFYQTFFQWSAAPLTAADVSFNLGHLCLPSRARAFTT